jgi:hypothetical protein
MTGTLKPKQVNDIGTAALHRRHAISLEQADSGVGRARVNDQMFIDKLLLKKAITIRHHQAAERILSQAVQAGVYLKSPDMTSTFGGSGHSNRNDRLLMLSRTFRKITKEFGEPAATLTYLMIVEDQPTDSQSDIDTLISVLEFV